MRLLCFSHPDARGRMPYATVGQKKPGVTRLTYIHAGHSVCRVPADQTDEPQTDTEMLRVGQRIREVRKRQQLTQERVFLAVPMNRSHYQEIEAGRANPTLRTLIRIADAMGVELEDLVRRG